MEEQIIAQSGAVTPTETNAPVAETGNQPEVNENVVHLNEILSMAQDSNAEEPGAEEPSTTSETVENPGDDGPTTVTEASSQPEPSEPVYRTQAEFDAAFSKRMAKERAQLRPMAELGRAVSEVAGTELTAEEVRAAISVALADKRAKANKTDFDTEMNNIRVEQRVMQRFSPARQQPTQQESGAPQNESIADVRAREMVDVMQAIGDDNFTPALLQRNQAAMQAWAEGATPAQIYKQFFVATVAAAEPAPAAKPKRPSPERAANSGAAGAVKRTFSDAELERIEKELREGKTISVV